MLYFLCDHDFFLISENRLTAISFQLEVSSRIPNIFPIMSEETHKFSEMYDNLLGQGICQPIAQKLDEIHQSGTF